MVKPIKKQILFQPYPSKAITESGFIIPESCQVANNKGTIKAIGNEVTKVKVGEVAYRTKLWGTEIVENGITYFIMTEDSILMVD